MGYDLTFYKKVNDDFEEDKCKFNEGRFVDNDKFVDVLMHGDCDWINYSDDVSYFRPRGYEYHFFKTRLIGIDNRSFWEEALEYLYEHRDIWLYVSN